MSDKPGIPAWQRAQATAPPPTTPPDEQAATPEELPAEKTVERAQEPTRDESLPESAPSSLLEQASRFLQDPTIRDAPREKKVAFLEGKGVAAEDIEQLLDSKSGVEPTSGTSHEGESTPDISPERERAWPNTPPAPFPSTSTPAPNPPARDIPPIVTYPEFLTPATEAPPLITTRRLINTAYVAGGLAATMYGLAKFIVAPMTESLAQSRHDFASHAKEQLDVLNTRLGDMVSEDPAHKPKPKISDLADDISEADSDPTELFHRDFGTQTTPSLSRRPSTSAPSDDSSMVTAHEKRLKILTSHIRELEATRSNDYASSESLKTKISDLSTYLGELSYQNQYYSSIGGIYGSTYGVSKKDDQIETLKSDIRAVKGVFLSARNFYPGGSPRTVGQVN